MARFLLWRLSYVVRIFDGIGEVLLHCTEYSQVTFTIELRPFCYLDKEMILCSVQESTCS